ncbi:MAG: hypothetical protein M3Q12_09475 [Pseudomonadota bacterium]|uniref:hypothetical protein n=1 Tax=Polaromonas sp. TaxID=1869339 RepID=UPI001822547E|nr:hypothetical protein [Polaromonas sp.]MBA3593655.1 hypothetical protein [Polaromonas sp.]MDQ3272377.1 hypothetical protein [Pseudomonadota bacterium]
MSEKPFSCTLSADKSQLKITPSAVSAQYSADEVSDLIAFLAQLRAQMSPPIAEESGDVVNFEGDRWQVFRKPADGSARIYSRIPGMGWSFIHLQEDAAVGLAGVLNPKGLVQIAQGVVTEAPRR